MRFTFLVPACLLAVPVACYSLAASQSLRQLATNISEANTYINHLEGCGYKNTTQAIAKGATVASDGSACPAADTDISSKLTALSGGLQSALAALQRSRADTSSGPNTASTTQVTDDFNAFASAFYTLFNAMDLAECTYILTTSSKSFAAQFKSSNSYTSLNDGYNALIAELSRDLGIAFAIAGTNLKQQTHFGGTSFLATQVGGLKPIALAGCTVITKIVESEGGGSS